MTRATLRARVLERLDDDPATPVAVTETEVDDALNEGQQVFAFMTLCLEGRGNLALSADAAFYTPIDTFPTWIAPLRVSVGGVRLRASRVQDLATLSATWMIDHGDPARYGSLAYDLLVFWPCKNATADVVYARGSVDMTADGHSPEIPEVYHPALIDYAIAQKLGPLGGTPTAKAGDSSSKFMAAVAACAAAVRQRSIGYNYDTLPPELKLLAKAKK